MEKICILCNSNYINNRKKYCSYCKIIKEKEWKRKEYQNNKLKYSNRSKNIILNKYNTRVESLDNNIWKQIKNYSNYYVSIYGEVFSIRANKILKQCNDKDGYKLIKIFDDNKISKQWRVHILVALTFILNPNNKSQVNHKDLNKVNNDITNLEWNTPKENVTHYHKNKLTT